MSFDAFVKALADAEIEFEQLKVVQLAQAIIESGRGKSDLFTLHNNPYGMKFRPEMASVARSVTYTDHAGETDQYCAFAGYAEAVSGYWKFIERWPYVGWRTAAVTPADFIRFIAFAGYVGGPHQSVPAPQRDSDRAKKEAYIAGVQGLFAEAGERLRSAGAAPAVSSPATVSAPPAPAPAGKIWKHKGVFIDVGHGNKPDGYDPGAVNKGSKITEHSLNLIAAKACSEAIQQMGVPVVVDDSNRDNLAAGKAGLGYDLFVSIHHNSAEGPAQASEAYYHALKGIQEDKDAAALAARAMADSLGIENRGAKPGKLTVLSGARSAGVRAAFLAELYFIHDQNPANPPPAKFTGWSALAGAALGRSIVEWLKRSA